MLNDESASVTPHTVTTRGGPKRQLRGVMVPVLVAELADEIVGLESEAYVQMGGTTTKKLSDIVSEALEAYVVAWVAENGPLPESPAERKEYVKKLAARNLDKLREQLLTKQ